MAAAVNGEVDASDEAGGIRRQEGDALGHFVHLAWSAQRVGLLALGKKLNRGEGRLGGQGWGIIECATLLQGCKGLKICVHFTVLFFVFCNISKVVFFFLSTIANF